MIQPLDELKRQTVNWKQTEFTYVMYTWYYMTLAMFHGGERYWRHWNHEIRDVMVDSQLEDGRWPLPPRSSLELKSVANSPVYSTALGAMILEVYYRYMPLHQYGDDQLLVQTTSSP